MTALNLGEWKTISLQFEDPLDAAKRVLAGEIRTLRFALSELNESTAEYADGVLAAANKLPVVDVLMAFRDLKDVLHEDDKGVMSALDSYIDQRVRKGSALDTLAAQRYYEEFPVCNGRARHRANVYANLSVHAMIGAIGRQGDTMPASAITTYQLD